MSLFKTLLKACGAAGIREVILRPTETLRTLEDTTHAIGDWSNSRSANEIYSREIPKAINRKLEDVSYNWKKALKL